MTSEVQGKTWRNEPVVTSRFRAYDKDGRYKGVVLLTVETRARYERMGFTFKREGGVKG